MNCDNDFKHQINPRKTANFLSLVTFFYTTKVFVKGYTKGLEIDDVYEVLPSFRSKILGDKIEQQWQKQSEEKRSPSICRVLWKLYGRTCLLLGLGQCVTTMVVTTWSPKATSKLISYFTPDQNNLTKQDAIFYACLIIALNIINAIVKYNLRFLLSLVAIKAKMAVCTLIFRKSLKMTSDSLSHVTVGKIVTVITRDVDVIELFVNVGNNMWIDLIQTGLTCYLIYRQIGIASISGIIFFLFILPLQVFIGKMTYKFRLKCSKKTDERLDLIREVLAASKVIKMYTWEKLFEQKILDARKEELQELHKLFYSSVWIVIIGSICSKIAFFIFLMAYLWSGNDITAEIIFYILSCFNNLESSLTTIPIGFSNLVQLYAIAQRIEDVLQAKELPKKTALVKSDDPKIVFEKVSIKIREINILKDISTTMTQGLYVVVGHTGSGKTTFLKSILQECETTGVLEISGTISYASQEPWLFPSTIKNNILFGEKFQKIRYHQVLKICNLEYDLDLLDEGDTTIIGESGINLSMGQLTRINLARALYKNSDIYLLDDSLASLDGPVSDNIFKNICAFLKNKLCIFVTNNLDYLQHANKIIMIDSGSVKFTNELNNVQSALLVDIIENTNDQSRIPEIEDTPLNKNIYYESKKSGVVPLRCYISYVKYGGFAMFGIIIALLASTHFAASYSDKIFSEWVNLEQNLTDYKKSNQTNTTKYERTFQERTHQLILYTSILTTSIILSIVKSFTYFYFIRMVSNNIHRDMVKNILNSTMAFFDCHFIGSVINRFTKDYLTIDDTLPYVAMECFTMVFTTLGVVGVITTVDYIFLLESIIFIVATCVVKQFCQPAGRNMERIHVIARNPIVGHLNSTLEGLTTIRASNAQELVADEFDKHQDVFTSAFCMVVNLFVSLVFFVKVVCIIFSTVIIVQFVATNIGHSVGDVGLVITQSFVITNIIANGIICVADCENLMISVERILEYTKLEVEEEKGQILIGWPKAGSINFRNVSLNHGSRKTLTDINLTVNPKEKVGIVGRSGAGKSSIVSVLLRLYPALGKITIDGIDIRDVSLTWLRSNISVIPQRPYLFPGTIRDNLDPLKQYSDDQIWKTLKELHLDHLIEDLSTSIDKGSTFSVGQKQLLCLVRVVLKRNKIVILDEATANVDQETEALMQEIIGKHFADCTMLVIAHKALPVQDCQKIIVLHRGHIKKFD